MVYKKSFSKVRFLKFLLGNFGNVISVTSKSGAPTAGEGVFQVGFPSALAGRDAFESQMELFPVALAGREAVESLVVSVFFPTGCPN